jgi:capsular polysaccharide biosynthesis protein
MNAPVIQIQSLDQLPGARAIAQLVPPQRYQRRAPTLVRVHAPEPAAHLAGFTQTDSRLPAQKLWALPEVTVLGKGHILANHLLVRDNLEGGHPPAKLLPELARTDVRPVQTVDEPLLYITRYGIRNYGHCLTDILPRIVHALQARPDLKVGIHPQFVEAALDALDDLGVSLAQCLLLPEHPVRLTQGFFPSACNQHPLTHCPTSLQLLRSRLPALLQKAQAEKPASAGKRLFVTRDDASTRHLTHHAEVLAALQRHGMTPVTTGRLSHAQQARMFHEADEIIALAGASLSNLMYCRPGTRVTMVAPTTMPALYFWDLASQCELDLRVGYFPATHPAKGIHSDFTAAPADILALHTA